MGKLLKKPKFIILLLTIVVFSAMVFYYSQSPSQTPIEPAQAQLSENIIVTNITRIMHPYYSAGNEWFGKYNPWNRDFTRIMLYEGATTHPDNPYMEYGRRLVWGFVDELKDASGRTIDDYLNAAKEVHENYNKALKYGGGTTSHISAQWSIFEGEEDIIYIPWLTGWLVKINVSDDNPLTRLTDVIYIDAEYGTTCYPWTTDNKLLCSINEEKWDLGGWEIDLSTNPPTKTWIEPYGDPPGIQEAGSCQNPETIRWPLTGSHGHSAKSPSGKLVVAYYNAANTEGIWDLVNCNPGESASYTLIGEVVPGTTLSHFSWLYTDEWFIADDRGDTDHYRRPSIDQMGVYQMWPNGSIRKIIEMDSAQWYQYVDIYDGDKTKSNNFHARPLPTIRKDGKQILFDSTNGKYSYDDYKFCQKFPSDCDEPIASDEWGFSSFYLADLAYESDQICSPLDLNCDQAIDSVDLTTFKDLWGSSDPQADFNQDSFINTQDFGIMMSTWGNY